MGQINKLSNNAGAFVEMFSRNVVLCSKMSCRSRGLSNFDCYCMYGLTTDFCSSVKCCSALNINLWL